MLAIGDMLFGVLAVVAGLMAILGVSYFKTLGIASRFIVAGAGLIIGGLLLYGTFTLGLSFPLSSGAEGTHVLTVPDWPIGLVLGAVGILFLIMPSFMTNHPILKYIGGFVLLLLGIALLVGWASLSRPPVNR
jgi:hypothetical protein